MLKMKMVVLVIFKVIFFCYLGLADAGQEETIQLLKLYTTSQEFPQPTPHSGLAIWVSERDLIRVSRSVLMAESWLRANLLSHYPSTQITTIMIGPTILCQKHQDPNNLFALLSPCLKNIHHSLTRWGLENDIKLSVTLSPSCFSAQFSQNLTKPILELLNSKNSTYSLNHNNPLEETKILVNSHYDTIKRLGLYGLNTLNLITPTSPRPHMTRKLSSLYLPPLPNPLPRASDPPQAHSSNGFSVPSTIASPPETSLSPSSLPPKPVYGYTLPPCDPSPAPAYRRRRGDLPAAAPASHGMWCVAKPSVPSETLQAAMDYACGDGGAECEDIAPSGECFEPDTLVAHASFAFNSYWQKHKSTGGTCSFGGTAMLINNDPSYLNCRFILS